MTPASKHRWLEHSATAFNFVVFCAAIPLYWFAAPRWRFLALAAWFVACLVYFTWHERRK
ncbi:MAG: hypothetical protein AB7O59_08010 [Pirellulales bacterium]